MFVDWCEGEEVFVDRCEDVLVMAGCIEVLMMGRQGGNSERFLYVPST